VIGQDKINGMIVQPDGLFFNARARIAELALMRRLPTMVFNSSMVESGGLMTYAPSSLAIFRREGAYVDKILKGTKPVDLPVELPTRFELVINLKTAKMLGLTIPPMLVAYTLPGGGKIVDPSIAPHDGEVVEPGSGPDKFLGSDLNQRLKDHGIKTVILCGTSAQGIGLGTGAAAAQRGYYVVYPVDCLPSESAFREAYAAWHMAGGGPPVTTKWATVTRSDMIKFENANH
jgi:hypothetical protein